MPRCPSCHRRLSAFAVCPADGARAARGAAPIEIAAEPPPSLAGFQIDAPLAAGAFSLVWSATRLEDGAAAALKVSRAHHLLSRERFRCEAWALEQLGPPVSPRLLQNGVLEDGRAYIAMERLHGETLAARLERLPAPLDPRAALDLALAVLRCVEGVHERGLIHQDLAPESVFLEADGGVRLLDFGLSQRDRGVGCHPADSTLATLGALLGAPEATPPERLRGEPVDGRADLYAFGALLFELLTLRPPFTGDRAALTHGHLSRPAPRPGDITHVPGPVEAIVLACLAKDRAHRPRDAAALRAALTAAAASVAGAGAAEGGEAPADDDAPAASHVSPSGDRHNTVVLAVEARGAEAEVLAAVARHGGALARQRGYRFVAIFPGPAETAAERALLAGREIVASVGAPLALHLAPLKLRREPDGAQVAAGIAIERPESWLPNEPWRGIALSAEIVGAHPGFDVSAASEDGRYFFAQDPPPPSGETLRGAPLPLVGRGDALLAVEESRARALSGLGPSACELTGERGAGKTRLAEEIAADSRAAHPRALVISLRGEPAPPGRLGRTARALLAALLGASDGRAPEDARAFCAERLGRPLGDEVWPAVAAGLGWGEAGSAAAPRPRRGSVLRALVEGLRRRALDGPVIVILDDAHLADGITLDALELAARPEAPLPLWVLLAGAPEPVARRYGRGASGAARDHVALAPLDDAAAQTLCAELLKPAEPPPAAALRRLCAWAGNNPLCLVELTRALKRAGFVRLRAKANSYHLAVAELDKLPPSPAWQWFAARQLEALPPELAACARLCAVLGFEISEDVAERVHRTWEYEAAEAAPRDGAPEGEPAAAAPADVRQSLRALAARGLLLAREAPPADDHQDAWAGGQRYTFRSALLEEALYALLREETRRAMHRHALSIWETLVETQPRAPSLLEPVARHAAAAGAHTRAAHAYLLLGDLQRDRHNNVAADSHYSSALVWADGDDQRRRFLALLGRARVRYRVRRVREALDDLRSAGALARTMQDPRLIAEALLEEATALDWASAWEESATRVVEALPLIEGHDDDDLAARLEVALGRAAFRRGNLAEAIERLTRGVDDVRAADHDAHVTGLTLLACALARSDQLDEAEQCFDEAVMRCEERGDRAHLGVALVRRAELWPALDEPARGIADLWRALELAREEANTWAEREATIRLAELLYLVGREDEALPLARQVRMIDEQLAERPVYESALLLARVHAMRDEHAEASRQLRWLRAQGISADLSAFARAMIAVLQLAVRDPRFSAEGSRARAAFREEAEPTGDLDEALSLDEHLELLYFRARALIDAGRPEEAAGVLSRATQRLGESRVWRPRFAQLRARYGRLAG